jgi:exosortase A
MKILTSNPRVLGWLLFVPVFLAAYSETVASLYRRWVKFDEAYGHGFLVLLIVLYLIYERRKEILDSPSNPNYLAAIPLLLLNILWFLSFQIDIEIVQQLLLPLILLLVAFLAHGPGIFKLLWFPLAFLYFAIPAWDYLNDLLISLTVYVVTGLVRLSGITAFIEADRITLSSGTIVVAAGCSGLRYLIICTALSSLSAYLTSMRTALRILVALMGVMLGLLTNWIRVYLLVMIGYYTEMESGLIKEHEMFGWVLFLIIFSPVYVLTSRLGQYTRPDPAANLPVQAIPQVAGAQVAVWMLVCLTACSGPLAARISALEQGQFLAADPVLTGYGQLESVSQDPYESVYYFGDQIYRPAHASAVLYEADPGTIHVASAIYQKNISSRNYLPYYRSFVDPEVWHLGKEERVSVAGHKRQLNIKELEMINIRTGDIKLLWYWFDIGGRISPDRYMAKILEVATIFSGRSYAGLTIIQADCKTACEGLRDVFMGLAQHADRAFATATNR